MGTCPSPSALGPLKRTAFSRRGRHDGRCTGIPFPISTPPASVVGLALTLCSCRGGGCAAPRRTGNRSRFGYERRTADPTCGRAFVCLGEGNFAHQAFADAGG